MQWEGQRNRRCEMRRRYNVWEGEKGKMDGVCVGQQGGGNTSLHQIRLEYSPKFWSLFADADDTKSMLHLVTMWLIVTIWWQKDLCLKAENAHTTLCAERELYADGFECRLCAVTTCSELHDKGIFDARGRRVKWCMCVATTIDWDHVFWRLYRAGRSQRRSHRQKADTKSKKYSYKIDIKEGKCVFSRLSLCHTGTSYTPQYTTIAIGLHNRSLLRILSRQKYKAISALQQ